MSETLPLENLLTPFMLENAEVRGRLVRLGSVADAILTRYPYPPCVAHALGELLVVASILSSSLKTQGILTIQIRSKGPVPLMVVDAVHGGALRGYADVDPAHATSLREQTTAPLSALFGDGAYLAITFDPGAGMQRYQGVVALEGATIADALLGYFRDSQQIEVTLQLAIHHRQGHWAAAGMLLERMPQAKPESDSWPYAQAIATTVTDAELLDPMLDAQSLLYRLFHESGVWVYEAQPLVSQCRCSRERIEQMLLSMPLTDRADMLVDGAATVHCQFCNTEQRFTGAELGLGGVQ